jgi:hypothetical protein
MSEFSNEATPLSVEALKKATEILKEMLTEAGVPILISGPLYVSCPHNRLDEDGICRVCGEDCRGFHS